LLHCLTHIDVQNKIQCFNIYTDEQIKKPEHVCSGFF
jgi:hypothetical protein